jgi:hypothetical protein
MRLRSGLLTASSALLLAGCGGGHERAAPPPPPRIPAGLAERLAAEADQVAGLSPGTCAARDAARRFRQNVIASIGAVPARYREQLMSATNDLAQRLATCPPPAPAPEQHGHGEHGNKKGHGKKRGHGDGQGDENG